MFNGPIMEDPINAEERARAANSCIKDLDLPIPAIVDRLDDKVNQAYSGWPDRLYLVGRNGKIVYAGGRGPFNFSPPELRAAIEAELKKSKSVGQY